MLVVLLVGSSLRIKLTQLSLIKAWAELGKICFSQLVKFEFGKVLRVKFYVWEFDRILLLNIFKLVLIGAIFWENVN